MLRTKESYFSAEEVAKANDDFSESAFTISLLRVRGLCDLSR